jgi:hypothetical protein
MVVVDQIDRFEPPQIDGFFLLMDGALTGEVVKKIRKQRRPDGGPAKLR